MYYVKGSIYKMCCVHSFSANTFCNKITTFCGSNYVTMKFNVLLFLPAHGCQKDGKILSRSKCDYLSAYTSTEICACLSQSHDCLMYAPVFGRLLPT